MGGWIDDERAEPWELARAVLAGLPLGVVPDGQGGHTLTPLDLDDGRVPEVVIPDGEWLPGGPWERLSDEAISQIDVTFRDGSVSLDAGSLPGPARSRGYLAGAGVQGATLTTSADWIWRASIARGIAGWTLRAATGWQTRAWAVPSAWAWVPLGCRIEIEGSQAIVVARQPDGSPLSPWWVYRVATMDPGGVRRADCLGKT